MLGLGPALAFLPVLAFPVMGVAYHPVAGVGNDETPAVEGGGLFQPGLQSRPIPVFPVVLGNQAIHPVGAELLIVALKAVGFLFGGDPHEQAHPGQGQGQGQGKGQNQPEPEAEKPPTRCQTCTPLRK